MLTDQVQKEGSLWQHLNLGADQAFIIQLLGNNYKESHIPSKARHRIGEVYGKLTVIKISKHITTAGNTYRWCRSKCGNETEVPSNCLLNKVRKQKSDRLHNIYSNIF